jgi:hypothetical protein
MARGSTNKLYRTWVKGLITEAGYLTYPENASQDELNTVVKRKGSRSRRLGFDYEPSTTSAVVTAALTDTTSEFLWRSVSGDSNVNFLVVQIANTLYFFNADLTPITSGQKSFTVDLLTYKISTATSTQVNNTACQMSSGKGYLFVAQEFIDPIVIDYDSLTDTVTVNVINIQIRDYDGLDDGLANDEQPEELSKEHYYNLRNQGWVQPGSTGVIVGTPTMPYTPPTFPTESGQEGNYSFFENLLRVIYRFGIAGTNDPIRKFYSKVGRFPANNQQWWLARSEVDDEENKYKAGDFRPDLLDKMFLGSMRAPRGHYVLHAFNKDRSAISGINGITAETINERPSTIAFFSGRVWYGCRSTVYFSQILTDKSKSANCYQEADPASEHISDPVATDGGVIEIPEASKIVRMIPHAGGVLVFARNGVWFITGSPESGFSALDVSVNKVSHIGSNSPFSIVQTDTSVFWWGDVGIMGMASEKGQFAPAPGFDNPNISKDTIQSFYNDISDDVRSECKAVFDPKGNTILWLYRDSDVTTKQYNRALLIDLTLNAFYPWKFSMAATPRIKGVFISNRMNTYSIPTDIDPSQIEYLVVDAVNSMRIGQARSGTFVDWQSVSGGVTYESYIETGYELFDDAMRDKNITYLFTYLTRTETADTAGVADYPSSCMMRIKWDWSTGSHSNKWTTPIEVYRTAPPLLDNADTGFGMVVTKSKVRGNGKSIQFRYESSAAGKNFDLNGWSVAVSGNTTP